MAEETETGGFLDMVKRNFSALGAGLIKAEKDVQSVASRCDTVLDELKEMTAERDTALLALEMTSVRNKILRELVKANDEHRKCGEFSTPYSPAIIAALEKCGHALSDARDHGLTPKYIQDGTPTQVSTNQALQAWTEARAEAADVERLLKVAEGDVSEEIPSVSVPLLLYTHGYGFFLSQDGVKTPLNLDGDGERNESKMLLLDTFNGLAERVVNCEIALAKAKQVTP